MAKRPKSALPGGKRAVTDFAKMAAYHNGNIRYKVKTNLSLKSSRNSKCYFCGFLVLGWEHLAGGTWHAEQNNSRLRRTNCRSQDPGCSGRGAHGWRRHWSRRQRHQVKHQPRFQLISFNETLSNVSVLLFCSSIFKPKSKAKTKRPKSSRPTMKKQEQFPTARGMVPKNWFVTVHITRNQNEIAVGHSCHIAVCCCFLWRSQLKCCSLNLDVFLPV